MADSCLLCGGEFLTIEFDSTYQKCCSNCGFVVDEPHFVEDKASLFSSTNAPINGRSLTSKRHLNRHEYQIIAKGKSLGRKAALLIGQKINCNQQMIEDAKSLFDRVFDHESFRMRRLKTKLLLAASCVYIVCRQSRWAVTLRDIATIAQCNKSDVDHWKKRIIDVFNIDIRSIDLLELAESRCEKLCLGQVVTTNTIEIIKLCRELWLSDGKNPENVVSAVSFIAWQSETLTNCRLKTPFTTYCQLFKFSHSKNCSLLVSKIKKILCQLAEQIPWVTPESINPTLVPLHLNDILKFQKTLIAEADISLKEELLSESDVDDDDEDSLTSGSQLKDDELRDESKKHPPPKSSSSLKRERKLSNDGDDDEETKKMKLYKDLDKEELGPDDINDNEIYLFIKTEEEIQNENKHS